MEEALGGVEGEETVVWMQCKEKNLFSTKKKGSCCLRGPQLQFYKAKAVLEMQGGDDHVTV